MSNQFGPKFSLVVVALIAVLTMPTSAAAQGKAYRLTFGAGVNSGDGFDYVAANIGFDFIVCDDQVTLVWSYDGKLHPSPSYTLNGRRHSVPIKVRDNVKADSVPIVVDISYRMDHVATVEEKSLKTSWSGECSGGQSKVIAPVSRFLGEKYTPEQVAQLLKDINFRPKPLKRFTSPVVERWLTTGK